MTELSPTPPNARSNSSFSQSSSDSQRSNLLLSSVLVQDNVPIEILPGLYVGSVHAAFNQQALLDMGITHVINVAGIPATFPQLFTYLTINLRDKEHSNLLACIPASNIFIESALEHGKVLVHCSYGRSRSAALVIAHLLYTQSIETYEEAVSLVRSKRNVISVNIGFERQLRAYVESKFDVHLAHNTLSRAKLHETVRQRSIAQRVLLPLERSEVSLTVPSKAAVRQSSVGSVSSESSVTTSSSHEGQDANCVCPSESNNINNNIDESCDGRTDETNCSGSARSNVSSILGELSSSRKLLRDESKTRGLGRGKLKSPFTDLFGAPMRPPRVRLQHPHSPSVQVVPALRAMEIEYYCISCHNVIFYSCNILQPFGNITAKSEIGREEHEPQQDKGDIIKLGTESADVSTKHKLGSAEKASVFSFDDMTENLDGVSDLPVRTGGGGGVGVGYKMGTFGNSANSHGSLNGAEGNFAHGGSGGSGTTGILPMVPPTPSSRRGNSAMSFGDDRGFSSERTSIRTRSNASGSSSSTHSNITSGRTNSSTHRKSKSNDLSVNKADLSLSNPDGSVRPLCQDREQRVKCLHSLKRKCPIVIGKLLDTNSTCQAGDKSKTTAALDNIEHSPRIEQLLSVDEKAAKALSISSMYIVEPMDWMLNASETQEDCGQLCCKSCSVVLGNFDWKGMNTSWGEFVAPAFHVDASKVGSHERPESR